MDGGMKKLKTLTIERRSGWSRFQYCIGFICVSIGIFLLNSHAAPAKGATAFLVGWGFIAFGIQACFVGFLINVITDIRWFLQQSLTVQREIRDKEEVSGSDESN